MIRSIYSSTLAYIVDSNVGRSSSAVASNSFFRGLFAFIATEIAVPLQVCVLTTNVRNPSLADALSVVRTQ